MGKFTKPEVGDILEATEKKGSYYNRVFSKGDKFKVAMVKPGVMAESPLYSGNYVQTYQVRVYKVDPYSNYGWETKPENNWWSVEKLKIVERNGVPYDEGDKNMTRLAIAMDRPALVQEITTVDGKRTNVGVALAFKNETEAQAYAKEQIVNTVRDKNDYREFAIFVEKSVARAKEPPVVFE
jgi:hypothetical protein